MAPVAGVLVWLFAFALFSVAVAFVCRRRAEDKLDEAAPVNRSLAITGVAVNGYMVVVVVGFAMLYLSPLGERIVVALSGTALDDPVGLNAVLFGTYLLGPTLGGLAAVHVAVRGPYDEVHERGFSLLAGLWSLEVDYVFHAVPVAAVGVLAWSDVDPLLAGLATAGVVVAVHAARPSLNALTESARPATGREAELFDVPRLPADVDVWVVDDPSLADPMVGHTGILSNYRFVAVSSSLADAFPDDVVRALVTREAIKLERNHPLVCVGSLAASLGVVVFVVQAVGAGILEGLFAFSVGVLVPRWLSGGLFRRRTEVVADEVGAELLASSLERYRTRVRVPPETVGMLNFAGSLEAEQDIAEARSAGVGETDVAVGRAAHPSYDDTATDPDPEPDDDGEGAAGR
jgi:Zn-dependent protease with chaperone function